jgi:hypothetical protein
VRNKILKFDNLLAKSSIQTTYKEDCTIPWMSCTTPWDLWKANFKLVSHTNPIKKSEVLWSLVFCCLVSHPPQLPPPCKPWISLHNCPTHHAIITLTCISPSLSLKTKSKICLTYLLVVRPFHLVGHTRRIKTNMNRKERTCEVYPWGLIRQ